MPFWGYFSELCEGCIAKRTLNVCIGGKIYLLNQMKLLPGIDMNPVPSCSVVCQYYWLGVELCPPAAEPAVADADYKT